jgi:phage tail sheath protein FI
MTSVNEIRVVVTPSIDLHLPIRRRAAMPEYLAPGVYVQEAPFSGNSIVGVPTSIAAFVDHFAAGPVGQPIQITSFSEFSARFGGLAEASESSFAIRQFFTNGGNIAWLVRAEPPSGSWDPAGDPAAAAQALIGDASAKTGLFALNTVDLFNILCIPATAVLPDIEAALVAVQATTLCAARRAMLILDPPQHDADRDTVAGITAWVQGNDSLRSPNAALYFPRPVVVDGSTGNQRRISASGTLAGLWARTDTNRGVWVAAAGTQAGLQGVADLAYAPTDTDVATLNPLAVDCLRRLASLGLVCWGARTLAGTDQASDPYRYVPVRRTALFIEESVRRGLSWAVFQPNGPQLWAMIRSEVGDFMQTLFLEGAFQGAKPDEAYLVRCDAVTNTQADIDNGIVRLIIGFAPLKPAEFSIIDINQPSSPAVF